MNASDEELIVIALFLDEELDNNCKKIKKNEKELCGSMMFGKKG